MHAPTLICTAGAVHAPIPVCTLGGGNRARRTAAARTARAPPGQELGAGGGGRGGAKPSARAALWLRPRRSFACGGGSPVTWPRAGRRIGAREGGWGGRGPHFLFESGAGRGGARGGASPRSRAARRGSCQLATKWPRRQQLCSRGRRRRRQRRWRPNRRRGGAAGARLSSTERTPRASGGERPPPAAAARPEPPPRGHLRCVPPPPSGGTPPDPPLPPLPAGRPRGADPPGRALRAPLRRCAGGVLCGTVPGGPRFIPLVLFSRFHLHFSPPRMPLRAD